MKISYTKYGIILLLVFIVSMGSSLAYYSWGSTSNTNFSIEVLADVIRITYDGGPDITGANLFPTDDKQNDGIKKEISVKVDRYSEHASFNLYLDLKTLPAGLKDESFRYEFYQGSSLLKSGNFKTPTTSSCTKNSTNHIVLLNNITPTTTTANYTLYIWIDGVNYTNPNTMMNQTFEFTLHADGENVGDGNDSSGGSGGSGGTNAATYLTNLYNSVTPTPVTTAGGESITQASSLGLMQDSFGNIRYYGADPDNYVTFNGETAGWRIIGVFDTEDENGKIEKRVKLIRSSSIGTFAYDSKPSGVGSSSSDKGSNDWSDARLMMLLNPEYETPSNLYAYEGSLYWNSRSGTCYEGVSEGTKSCDFTTTGLTDTGKNMIGKAKYYLGGHTSSNQYVNLQYEGERGTRVVSGHATSWTGYVGLMYPSDYGYATDLSLCTQTGNKYGDDTANCTGTDWLFNSSHTLTITPFSSRAFQMYTITDDGAVTAAGAANASTRNARPVVYLKSNINIVSGTGKPGDSFILG